MPGTHRRARRATFRRATAPLRSLAGGAILAALAVPAPLATAVADPPAPGTEACGRLLAVDVEVVAAAEELGSARDAFDLLGAGGTTEQIAEAQARLDVASSTLDEATAEATVRLCTATDPDPGPTDPVDPDPVDPDPVDPDPVDPPTPPTTDPTESADTPPASDAPAPLPTDDDGSVVTGSQVREIPQGSVDTGRPY